MKIRATTRYWPGILVRLRKLVAFDRFLARLVLAQPDALTAIQATFGAYGLDEPPLNLPPPPSTWRVTFKKLAEEVGLSALLG